MPAYGWHKIIDVTNEVTRIAKSIFHWFVSTRNARQVVSSVSKHDESCRKHRLVFDLLCTTSLHDKSTNWNLAQRHKISGLRLSVLRRRDPTNYRVCRSCLISVHCLVALVLLLRWFNSRVPLSFFFSAWITFIFFSFKIIYFDNISDVP